jgi:hypothetical protein
MRSNLSIHTILGTINHGQAIVVEGTHRSTLRELLATFTRRLSLRLGGWRALQRMPAAMPAMATCPSYSASRIQRQPRWVAGVVVDPGTVGVD